MSQELPPQGWRDLQGDSTNQSNSQPGIAFLTSNDVSSSFSVPEVRHGLERTDRRERITAILSEMSLQIGTLSERVMSNLLRLEDTFINSLEELMYAVPYENEVDNSRKLLTGLVGSADRVELKRKLGASTVMYGRKDHSKLLWLVQGLQKELPEDSNSVSMSTGVFHVADIDD